MSWLAHAFLCLTAEERIEQTSWSLVWFRIYFCGLIRERPFGTFNHGLGGILDVSDEPLATRPYRFCQDRTW